MTHPHTEDLLLFYYGECDSLQSKSIKQHVIECQICEAQLTSWKSVSSSLDNWTIPSPPEHPVERSHTNEQHLLHGQRYRKKTTFIPILVGVALTMLLGFFVGRWTLNQPKIDIDSIVESKLNQRLSGDGIKSAVLDSDKEKEIHALIREQIQLQYPKMSADEFELLWESRNKTLELALRELILDQQSLRKDLETLAVNAESRIKENRLELNALIRRTTIQP